jgi:ribosomal protein S18 acetylase RimI-like enzyme
MNDPGDLALQAAGIICESITRYKPSTYLDIYGAYGPDIALYGLIDTVQSNVVAAALVHHERPATYINHLAVRSDRRGQGHANSLLSHVAIEAVFANTDDVQVVPLDDEAAGFFRHVGFVQSLSSAILQASAIQLIDC